MEYRQAYREFLAYLQTKGYSNLTITSYRSDGRRLERYLRETNGPRDVRDWEPRHFARCPLFLAGFGVTPRTLERQLNSFRSFCQFLLRFDYVASDPARRTESPKVPRRLPDYLYCATRSER